MNNTHWPNLKRASDSCKKKLIKEIDARQPIEDSEKVIRDFIKNTDWKAYWDEVTKACEPEIEAYRQARAKSMGAIV